ncbi:DUF3667 domain-containing protein [bacterium SCSIO 12643]|nr:DUF3667 domain-containing protein [bacterium SCSIO 12643]
MENLPRQNDQKPSRITWAAIWTDFLSVMNFERGVLYTLRGLLQNPKQTIDEYLYESRWNHANPMRLLIFSTALLTLLNYYFILVPNMNQGNFNFQNVGSYEMGESLGKGLSELEEDMGLDIKKKPKFSKEEMEKKKQEMVKLVMDRVFQYMDKFTFSLVPIFAFFTFFFFRKSGYNYTENLVINAFMISEINVMNLLTVAPTVWYPIITSLIGSIAMMVFTMYYIMNVFGASGIWGFIKAIFAMTFSYIVYALVIMSVMLFMVQDMILT